MVHLSNMTLSFLMPSLHFLNAVSLTHPGGRELMLNSSFTMICMHVKRNISSRYLEAFNRTRIVPVRCYGWKKIRRANRSHVNIQYKSLRAIHPYVSIQVQMWSRKKVTYWCQRPTKYARKCITNSILYPYLWCDSDNFLCLQKYFSISIQFWHQHIDDEVLPHI